MKILIVGGKGMLGSMLAEVFADMQPTSWDKEDIDITGAEQTREKIRQLRPEVIINAAAYTDVDGAEEHQDVAFAVNEDGVRNLAAAASEIDAIMVHYSTDYVFPGDKKAGYAEDDSPGPAVNVYGASKLAGERALVAERPKFYLQRTAWLYGPNGKNFVQTMRELAESRDFLTVVNDQFGSPTYTKDVALATRTMITERYPFGIYHTANEGVASWYDFASRIFQLTYTHVDIKPATSDEFPRLAKRPTYSVLLNTKGPKMRPWQKALEDYLAPVS